MVLTWESGIVYSKGGHACPLRGSPFEFHAFLSLYFGIFFIPPGFLAIISLSE
jgi:hypothetical protein